MDEAASMTDKRPAERKWFNLTYHLLLSTGILATAAVTATVVLQSAVLSGLPGFSGLVWVTALPILLLALALTTFSLAKIAQLHQRIPFYTWIVAAAMAVAPFAVFNASLRETKRATDELANDFSLFDVADNAAPSTNPNLSPEDQALIGESSTQIEARLGRPVNIVQWGDSMEFRYADKIVHFRQDKVYNVTNLEK